MSSKDRILTAAIMVFARKGRHGARMEEIAAEAAINKAMIYYLFHSKDELYFEVLKHIFMEMFEDGVRTKKRIVESGKKPEEMIADHIENAFHSFNNRNPDYTKILIDSICSGAEEIPRVISYCKSTIGEKSTEIIDEAVTRGLGKGVFRDISPEQLNLSILGMILVYSMTRGLCDVLDISVGDENEFLEKRKQSITDLVLHGVLKK
ncbi:MAG TPA: TetR/AcrR family transcriptional regulator [Spirochaetota bacterium]